MDKNKIICPNCGAENEYGGNCQYCGSPLQNIDSNIVQENESKVDAHFLNTINYRYFGENFDKIEKVTKTIIRINMLNNYNSECDEFSFYRERTQNGKELVFIRVGILSSLNNHPATLLFNINGRRYSISPARVMKTKSKRAYHDMYGYSYYPEIDDTYYEIDKNILKEFCEVSKIIVVKFSFENVEPFTVSIDPAESARLLYNRLFDHSVYMDTIEAFQHRTDEFRKKYKQEVKNRKREEKMYQDLKKIFITLLVLSAIALIVWIVGIN